MSMKLMVSVMEAKTGSPTEKLVLLKLADNANEKTGECWPSYETIARHCEISRSTAMRTVKKLVSKGLVKKEARKTLKGHTSNLYWIDRSAISATAGGSVVTPPSGTVTPPLVAERNHPSGTVTPRTSHRTSKIEPVREQRAKRATQVPKDFKPTNKHADLANRLGVGLSRELPKFIDYYLGTGKPMKDWNRTFNNWLRKAAEYQKPQEKMRSRNVTTANDFFS